ncbi:hypothetical protein PIB30_115746, partial [Stylosanthes scabra]|nr:hypothetical protein [Stylosanthes scabra]
MQYPQENDTENCMRVDAIDSIVQEIFDEEISSKSEELSPMEELENVAAEKEE